MTDGRGAWQVNKHSPGPREKAGTVDIVTCGKIIGRPRLDKNPDTP